MSFHRNHAYLNRLHGVMGKDPARARMILQKLIGEVSLKLNQEGLEAILQGNLPGILDLDRYCTIGAGRGISSLPNIGGVLELV